MFKNRTAKFQFCYIFILLLLFFVPAKSIPVNKGHPSQGEYEFEKMKRMMDHKALEDESGTTGYVWDLNSAIFGNYHPKFDIPAKNVRQILLLSLLPLESETRMERTSEFMFYILKKDPIFEKKEDVQTREMKLLNMGVVAQCQWAVKLPPPFDTKQCTVEELDVLIDRICIDTIFKGLPKCPENVDNIPVLS